VGWPGDYGGRRLNRCTLEPGSAACWQTACRCPAESRGWSSFLEAPGIQMGLSLSWPSLVRTSRAKTGSFYLSCAKEAAFVTENCSRLCAGCRGEGISVA